MQRFTLLTFPWIRICWNSSILVELLHFFRCYNKCISRWIVLDLASELAMYSPQVRDCTYQMHCNSPQKLSKSLRWFPILEKLPPYLLKRRHPRVRAFIGKRTWASFRLRVMFAALASPRPMSFHRLRYWRWPGRMRTALIWRMWIMLIIEGALGSSMRRRRRLRVAIPSSRHWSPLGMLLWLLALYIIKTSRLKLLDHIGGNLRNDLGG